MSITVRPYQTSDLAPLMEAWEKASALAHPFLSESYVEKVRYEIPNIYIPNTDTWVAELDEDVVGFISLMGNEIGGLFVDPAFHGKGAGRCLVEKARALHGDLEVEVFERNHIGRRFYQHYGFEQVKEYLQTETGCQVLRLKYTI